MSRRKSRVKRFIKGLGGPAVVGKLILPKNRAPAQTVCNWQFRDEIPAKHWPKFREAFGRNPPIELFGFE